MISPGRDKVQRVMHKKFKVFLNHSQSVNGAVNLLLACNFVSENSSNLFTLTMKIFHFYTAVILLTLTGCRKEVLQHPEPTLDKEAFHNRPMGGSAAELLSDRTYKALDVEIQYVTGFRPADLTLDHLGTFLETYLNKPRGI